MFIIHHGDCRILHGHHMEVPSVARQAHHEVRPRLGVVAFRLEGPQPGNAWEMSTCFVLHIYVLCIYVYIMYFADR